MSKEDLLKRLTTLVKLCEDTEPTSKELMYMDKLFSEDLITSKEYYNDIKDETYDSLGILDIMTNCNWIWKKRLKIKEIGWAEYNNIDRKIEDSLRANRKIEAIKIYRQHKIDNGEDCSLREAKDYIDNLQVKMGLN
jgi:hypothetical protein